MKILLADLEGVFLPEIWINIAKKTGIDELKLTTRDINDYNLLMKRRLSILKEHGLKIQDIQAVLNTIEPLDGALETLNWIRQQSQIIILSDTFEEFAKPLMPKLEYPTLLCHSLEIDKQGNINNYRLRIENQKQHAVKAFRNLNYYVIAFGDSYNDISMIKEADQGFFFCPPDGVIKEYPEILVTRNYSELKAMIQKCL